MVGEGRHSGAEKGKGTPEVNPRLMWGLYHARCHAQPFQRGQALLRVSSWWMFGAPVLLWSGHLPKTRATQHSGDTPCRRLTQNLG